MTQTNRSSVPLLRNLLLMSAGGTILALLVIAIGVWRAGDRFFGALTAAFTPSLSEPKLELTDLIVERVRGANELTTAIFAMEAIVPAQQDRRLGNLTVGRTRLLYIAYGEVRAGVDLAALDASNVTIGTDTVTVRLPPPRILDRKIDVERSRVYDYDREWLGPDVAPQLQTLAARETLQRIVISACEQGILADANQRAKLAVGELLNAIGSEREATVITTPPAPDACR